MTATKSRMTAAEVKKFLQNGGSDLSGSDLSGLDLSGIDLSCVDLSDTDLSGADLTETDISTACLARANLSGAVLPPNVPTVDRLPERVAEVALAPGALEMDQWHSPCGTAHCWAGWIVTLAGRAGAELEWEVGTNTAAAFIYARSCPGRIIPDWYTATEYARIAIEKDASA